MQSIKAYSENQDAFNWNYGLAKAATGQFAEAEESLLSICSTAYREDYSYLAWLSHCLIMNGKAQAAWELYLRLETYDDTTRLNPSSFQCLKMHLAHCPGKFPLRLFNISMWARLRSNRSPWNSLLQLIGNESYKTSQYLCAAKAFDALERTGDSGEFWEGKRGACIGVFRRVIAGQEPKESLQDIVLMLCNSPHPQVLPPSKLSDCLGIMHSSTI